MRAVQVPEPIGVRTAFTAEDRSYTWTEVVAAAEERGDVDALEREAVAGLAGLAQVTPDPKQVEVAGDDFRRRRRLLSADEMQAWLEHWGLTLGRWSDYLRRAIARGEAPGSAANERPEPEVLWAEAVCSAALNDWAWKLAARTAVGGDAAYEALLRDAATPAAQARALEQHQVDWLRVDFELLELPAEGMAREAALCVRDDGLSVREVAERAGLQAATHSLLLRDAPEGLAEPLLSATPGDVVGPVAAGEAYAVALVRAKRPPAADDPVIQDLLEDEVPRRAVESEVNRAVKWHEWV